MDIQEKDLNAIKTTLDVGFSMSTLDILLVFAVRNGKKEFIDKMKQLSEEFRNSLSKEEKDEVAGYINDMMKEKVEEFIKELGKSSSEEEIDELLSQLKKSTFSEK